MGRISDTLVSVSVLALTLACLLACLLPRPLHAQSIPSGYVNTTATIPALANGQFASAWTNLSSSPQLGLLGCVSSFQTTVNGRFNASGHFAVLLADTAQICPSPSTWTFTFTFSCSAGSIPSAFVVQVPVTGGGISEDISSQITSALPATQCSSGGGGGGGSGSPAPPGYAVQLANSSATGFAADPNIFINPFTHTLTAEILNGVRNSASFALSPGGIAACASGATGQTCVADPTYALSEQYSLTSMIPNIPGQFTFEDLRNGIATNFHHDWAFTTNNFGSSAAIFDVCLTDGVSAPTVTNNNWTRDCHDLVGTDTTRGWDQGQQAVGVQGWYSTHGMTVTANVNGMGITEGFGTSQTKYGVGDNAGLLSSVTGFGGFVAGADEGTKPLSVYNNEGTFVPTVTCSTGCTTGSTSFKGTAVVNAVTSWGVGRYVIDTTQTPTSTTISTFTNSSLNSGAGDTSSTVTVAATVPVSNAWGTLSGACSPGVRNNTPPFTTSTACSVTVTNGTFDTTHLVCFKAGQHECTIPTAVANGSGPTATVTMNMTGTGHENGSTIMQGGMAGYGMDATFYDQTIGGQTFRYLYDVIGSTTSNTMEVQGWYTTGARALQFSSYPGWSGGGPTIPGSANLSTLSSSGTTVNAVYVASGSTLTLPQYNKGTILISGASDTALNAACTNVVFTTSTAFTCTIAGLSSTHTATTAAAGLSTSAGTTVAAINLYPMAEVLDVQNEALTPPAIDGTMTLEPNVMVIAPGDTLEEDHAQSAKFTVMTGLDNVYNPFNNFGGIGLTSAGAGVQGGGGSVTAAAFLSLGSTNADSMYKGGGGALIPPNIISMTNAYFIGINTNEGPTGGQPFLNIATTAAQRNDPNYTYPLFISANLSSATSWTFTPNTGNTAFNTNGVATWTASSHTFNGAVTVPSLTIPSCGGKYALADGTGCGTPSGTLPNATDTFNTIQVNSSGTGSVVTAAITGTWEAHQQGNADNTGSVDASTILNAETTTVCASATPPRIHLAAGTYTINSSWTIAATSTTCKNLVIEGDGSGNTILQGNCSSHPYVVGWINSTSPAAEAFAGPTFRHLTIKNTDAHSPNHCAIGLLISQAALFKVNDLVITGFAGQTYATGTISSSGSTVTGSGTTFTAAMVHGFIETTSGNTTARAEICAFGSTTSLTLCDSAFPTGDLSASTAYALPYGGAGLVCDPGAGISGSPFTQYSTISDVYAPGNLIGIDAWGTTAGGCSRVQVTGNAGYISASPGSRVTDAVGIWLGHNSDTWEISAPINNVAVGIVNDSGHAQRISAKVENGGTLTPVTTCNGGVASQACTAAFEWSSDTNGHGWNTYFDSAYAYVIGNVYQFDNAGGAFNASITAPRDLSGQYTQHYSFSGTPGCPAIGSGVLTQIRAYDCSYDPNYVAHGYLSFATGEITTITANGQFNPTKITSTVTAVNITATADAFTCSVNPVITLEDCGTSAGVCGSPSALGSVTLTAANTITDGTVSTPTLTAGHYIAWETTAGACTDLNVSGSVAY